jgi:hypothetical protein
MKQKMLFLIIGIVAMFIMVTSASAAVAFTLSLGSTTAPPGGETNLPIQAHGATNVGAVQFEITYDDTLLTPLKVEASSLAPNALVEFNADTPGRLAIGVVTVAPINGDGPLVSVRFKVNATQGQVIPLTLENAQAWDETSLLDMLVTTEPGQITVASDQTVYYLLIGAAAVLCCLGLIVIILLIVWLVRRRK